MNSYKYKPSTVLFDERIKTTLSKIQANYNNGRLKTKSEYAYEIKDAIYNFYKNIGKPTYRFIEASDVPSFLNYKEMVKNAVTDMREITTGCQNLNKIIYDMNEDMSEIVNEINNTLFSTESKISEIENKITSISDASSLIYSDSFSSPSSFEHENTLIVNNVDATNGTCKLKFEKQRKEVGMVVEILSTSNGFLGNTHEVYETVSGIKYVGDIEPRNSISSVLNDNTNDWFEFEMYNLDSETKSKTSSVGFRYKEGIEWISDDDKLKLDLKITMQTPAILNVFKISGLPKVNYHTSNPIITEIIITDDYAGTQVINYGKELKENTVINFKPQIVSKIILKIVQTDSIITKVARSYSVAIDTNKIPYFTNDNYEDYTKIDNPTVSIEALGLSYDYSTKGIIYPNTSSNNSFLSKEFIKSNLFYSDIRSDNNNKIFTDIINAYRYRIGISNISLEYKEYSSKSIYISKEFLTPVIIKRVTLNATDTVPHSFNPNVKDQFIKYYLCFNDEQEWYQIYPRTSNNLGPCSVVINSHLNVEARSKNVKYIDRLIDAYSVRLKIELSRPEHIIDETPIILEYNLDVDGEE